MPHSQPLAELPVISSKASESWKTDLDRDGFAVVKNVIPEERAAYYVEQMHDWLEGFNLGYNRADQTTWKSENVPVNMKYLQSPVLSCRTIADSAQRRNVPRLRCCA